ncbi:MAG: hypothetical protein EA392_09405 [Cryomorphaceae bacterium]|nr:MAG: hypothetical protein EA392_09405 [Cryomorphaceae bacterium]
MLKKDTSSIQGALAQYCRDGIDISIPGTSPERLKQYRKLVLNVVHSILTEAYPIAVRFLGTDNWNELVERFFAEHKCHNPRVWRMARELLEFVEETGYHKSNNLPFLPDLLMMEWTEIEVHSTPDLEVPAHVLCADNQLLSLPLVFNPHYRLLHLTYPVHRIHRADFISKPGNFFLLVFREKESGKVQFVSLSLQYAALLETLLESEGLHALGAMNALIESGSLSPDSFDEQKVLNFLKSLQSKQFILGKAA